MARGFARFARQIGNAGVLGAGSDQSRARSGSVNTSHCCSDCQKLKTVCYVSGWGGSLITAKTNLSLSRRGQEGMMRADARSFGNIASFESDVRTMSTQQ